ncbi:hypothetical protein BKA66DRAFT_598166 [Pyrenochaeta sp. MPI-SDFR-AT-0127]|nr:hypothetical protein BKA66DRAFT_598166 [Pyrenochaeta sp. MPI-SDFR-AT-0127]
MKLIGSSELMKNQKHAEVMSPDMTFDVLQTPEGDSLFFSIGTDHVLYVTREVRQSQTGWTRIDVSSSIFTINGGNAIQVKAFAVAQNPQTFKFDVALVVTTSGADSLYMSLGHSNSADDWANGVTWSKMPFDAAGITAPSPLNISDIYLMNVSSGDDSAQPDVLACFVDVIRSPGDPLQILDRYYITPSSPTKWCRHTLAANLEAGSISSVLGHRSNDYVPGIYTFGMIGGKQELIFVPQYNYWNPNLAPSPARLTLPPQSSAIASALDGNGETTYNQHDSATATLVVPNVVIGGVNLFAGVRSLSASTVNSKTVVWAMNAQGELFHTDCPAGSETTISAWSYPVPFAAGITQYAFYLNNSASNTVLFAYSSGDELLQFTQQSSGEWVQRSIMLPTTDMSNYVEYTSFTTHIAVQDDYGAPVPSTSIAVTSEVPVPVYINNTYYVLQPSIPVQVKSDANGIVTVVQETNTLAGVKLTAAVSGPNPASIAIDPLANATTKLLSIRTGDDLSSLTSTAANGSQKPLIPSDVDNATRSAVAQSLVQLMQVKQSLSTKNPATSSQSDTVAAGATASNPGTAAIPNGPITGTSRVSLVKALTDSFKLAAEDFFNFFKRVCHQVSDFVVHFANDAWHFVVQIGNAIYHTILDTVTAVVNAVEFLFNKLKVAFEDLVRWLGFLFSWDDIKRTHSVLKHVLKTQSQYFIDSIDSLEANVEAFFNGAEDQINAWADVSDPGETLGMQRKQAATIPGSDTPQTHWATYHTQNGMDSAQTNGTEPSVDTSAISNVLKDLEDVLSNEVDNVKTSITQIKDQVLNHIYDLTPIQLIKKILAIAGDLVLKTGRDMIVKVLDMFKLLVQTVLDAMDAPLSIPILSPLYKLVFGDDLTILDLVCFVSAIPATILYKIARGAAPFGDDAAVQALVQGGSGFSPNKVEVLAHAKQETMKPISFMVLNTAPHTPGGTSSTKDSADSVPPGKVNPSVPAAAPKTQTWSTNDILKTVLTFAVLPSGALLTLFTLRKRAIATAQRQAAQQLLGGAGPADPSPFVRYGCAASYLFYMAPNFAPLDAPYPWYATMNYTIAGIDAMKALADAHETMYSHAPTWSSVTSPILESFINTAWLVPAVGSYADLATPAASDKTGLAANLCFDVGGILTPGLSPELFDPEVNSAVFVATVGLTGFYVALSGVSAGCFVAEHD